MLNSLYLRILILINADFNTSQSLLEYLPKVAKPLGMVPTMGAIHLDTCH